MPRETDLTAAQSPGKCYLFQQLLKAGKSKSYEKLSLQSFQLGIS